MLFLTCLFDLIYLLYIPYYIYNERIKRKIKKENKLYATLFGSDIIFMWGGIFVFNNIWSILYIVFEWSDVEMRKCIPIQIIIFALFLYIYLASKWKIVLSDENILVYGVLKKKEYKYTCITKIILISTVYMFFSGNDMIFKLSYKHNDFSDKFVYTISERANIKIDS